MKNEIEFEILAKLHEMDISKTESNDYFFVTTQIAKVFWDAQQVKIDKLEHDLAGEKCANRMPTHVLDNATKARK